MTLPPPSDHFEGKGVEEHLRIAREKGAMATREVHGAEMPGHLSAMSDAGSDLTYAIIILWIVLIQTPLSIVQSLIIMTLFSAGWIIWKTARSAKIAWNRLERLHRLIEEERWEIQHHRHQEREELAELYEAKGFSGKLLEEIVDVLMADDDRLLRVMLEEELGVTLEAYEHPLKQAIGAFFGALIAAVVLLLAFWTHPQIGVPIFGTALIALAAVTSAKLERNRALNAFIWNLAIAFLTAGMMFFLTKLLLK